MLMKYKKYILTIVLCLLITSGITFVQPLLVRMITDKGMIDKALEVIIGGSFALLLISVIRQTFQLLLTKKFADLHNDLQCDLLKQSFKKFVRLPMIYFEQKNSTEVINTVHTDISMISNIADTVSSFSISAIMQMFGGIIGLFLINRNMTIFILAVIPIRYILVDILSKKKSVNFKKFMEYRRIASGWLGDQIEGIREYKLWNMFTSKIDKYTGLEKQAMGAYKKNRMLDEYNTSIEQFIDAFIAFVIYIVSGYLIINNEFTIGSAFAFITYSAYVASPINLLVNVKYNFAEIKPSADRLFAFFDHEEENSRFGRIKFNQKCRSDSIVLECRGITFGYDMDRDILEDIDLTIREHEKIGIIGDNGSGKTTLLNLIMGFISPTKGETYLCGLPYSELDINEIRDNITVVGQKNHLFQTTIKDNIDLNGKINIEEIKKASTPCGADEFIQKLAGGYDYDIGVNGSNLSGGERQKIAMARAMLKPRVLWIFDEATTGFDVDSEKLWNKLLREELKGQTVIMITHKYSELKNMDRVFRLEKGKLEEVFDWGRCCE